MLFFVWEAFFEKLLRIIILTVVPGLAQSILLTTIACFSLLTYVYRNPQSERILNYQSQLGKFTEFYSFAAITAGSGSGTLEVVAPMVLGINQGKHRAAPSSPSSVFARSRIISPPPDMQVSLSM